MSASGADADVDGPHEISEPAIPFEPVSESDIDTPTLNNASKFGQFTAAPQSEHASETMAFEYQDVLSTLKNLLSGDQSSRRRQAVHQSVPVSHEVQIVEPRLLLAGAASETIVDDGFGPYTPQLLTLNEETQSYSVEGQFESGEDLFRLDLTEPTSIAFLIESIDSEERLSGYVFDETTSTILLQFNSYAPVGLNLESGTYYIRANNSPLSGDSRYQISAQVSETPFIIVDEPDRIGLDVPLVEFNPETGAWLIEGTIDHPHDQDYFRIEIPQRTIVAGEAIGGSNFWREDTGQAPHFKDGQALLDAGTWYFGVHGSGNVDRVGDYTYEFKALEFTDLVDDHLDFISPDLQVVELLEETQTFEFSGKLNDYHDLDYFQLKLGESSLLAFDTQDTNHTITVYNSAEDVVDVIRPGEYELAAGTWYVKVAVSPNSPLGVFHLVNSPNPPTGDYAITAAVTEFDLIVDDHADAFGAEATTVELGLFSSTKLTGFFETADDRDVFHFSVDEPVRVRFYSEVTGGDLANVRLLDSSGNEITGPQPAPPLQPGDYYIEVTPGPYATAHSYQVEVIGDDHGSAQGVATQLELDPDVGGFVASGVLADQTQRTDSDYFLFDLDEPTLLEFSAEAEGGELRYQVFAADDNESINISDGAVGFGAGTYRIQVVGGSGRDGAYSVTAKVLGPHVLQNDDYPDQIGPDVSSVPLEFDGEPGAYTNGRWTFEGRIDRVEDVDYFRFEVAQRSIVTIDSGTTQFRLMSTTWGFSEFNTPRKTTLGPGVWYLSPEGRAGEDPHDYSIVIELADDDHEDSPSRENHFVNPILRGDPVVIEGVLNDAEDRDVFRILPNRHAKIEFDIPADGPTVVLQNPAGELQSISGSGSFEVHAAAWYIIVSQSTSNVITDYRFEVTATEEASTVAPPTDPPVDPLDPCDCDPGTINDLPDQIGPDVPFVEFNEAAGRWTFASTTEHINDADYFRFEVDEPTAVRLIDEARNSGFQDANRNGASQIDLNIWRLDPGTWYFYAAGSPGRQSGSYSFDVDVVELPDALVPDAETGIITVSGSMVNPGSFQVFDLQLESAAAVSLPNSDALPRVEFLNANGVAVSAVNDVYHLAEGTWKVRVSQTPQMALGDYTFDLTTDATSFVADLPNSIGPDVPFVPFQDDTGRWTFASNMEHINDSDYFRIEVDETTAFRLLDENRSSGIRDAQGQSAPRIESDTWRLDAGTWYVYIDGSPGLQAGQYSIDAELGELPDVLVPDPETGIITVRGSESLSNTGGTQIFDLHLESAASVSLPNISGLPRVQFLNADGVSAPYMNGAYQLAAGEWLVRVSGRLENVNNTFDLTTGEFDDHPDNTGADDIRLLNPIAMPAPITGINERTDDVDVFQFEVNERSRVQLDGLQGETVRVYDASGNTAQLRGDFATSIQTQVERGTWYVAVSGADAAEAYALSLDVTSAFFDAIMFNSAPEATLQQTPTFHWDAAEGSEFEVFISRAGETTAVYRSGKVTGTSLELPETLEKGDYTAWIRQFNADGTMSRWGVGHDFSVAGRPEVTIDGNQVSWTAVDGAQRYELWVDELAADGSLLQRKAISETELTETSYTVSDELADSQLRFWVRAEKDAGERTERSGWSLVAMNREIEYLAPVTIVPNGDLVENGPPRITWQTSSDAVEYEVFIAVAGSKEAVFRSRGVTDNKFELPDDLTGDHYTIWVRSWGNGVAKSRWSQGYELNRFSG